MLSIEYHRFKLNVSQKMCLLHYSYETSSRNLLKKVKAPIDRRSKFCLFYQIMAPIMASRQGSKHILGDLQIKPRDVPNCVVGT
jgi:hypothetical protein